MGIEHEMEQKKTMKIKPPNVESLGASLSSKTREALHEVLLAAAAARNKRNMNNPTQEHFTI